jgi:2,4-dienoyl-CoA reductase-like NADH-dependent reductase (Old Yellow Enzyme family)/thioredoxin reductase
VPAEGLQTSERKALRHLFSPLTVAGFEVPNRLVMTPLGGSSAARKLPYFKERASSGVGMIVIPIGAYGTGVNIYSVSAGRPVDGDAGFPDAIFPNPATPDGIRYYDDRVIPDLREVADTCRPYGALLFAQIVHVGGVRVYDNLTPTVAPSEFRFEEDRQVPHALDGGEIHELVLAHAHAVRRIREAGIQGAEIHAAHGYLVNQFLSPLTNQRTDTYGGSLENRMRFLTEILDESEKLAGADFPMSIRINGSEDAEGGLTADDMAEIASILEPRLAYVSVSRGTTFGLRQGAGAAYAASYLTPRAFNLEAASRIKQALRIPVLAAGRFTDPEEADRAVGQGLIDLVGQAREMLADPLRVHKLKAGRRDEIRPCIGYNECHMFHQAPINMLCAVNPFATREAQLRAEPAAVSRRVVVVGAGPAGMEAAAMASERGHTVTLIEREPEVGGQLLAVARQPGQDLVLDFVRFQRRRLELTGVDVRVGSAATADAIVAERPDVVLVATGAKPYLPAIPGIDRAHVVTAVDVLMERAALRGRVLVVAGGNDHIAPLAVADFIAERGHQVHLIAETIDLAPRVEKRTLHLQLRRLAEKDVRLTPMTILAAVGDNGVEVADTLTRARRSIEGIGTVVIACGGTAVNDLQANLKGRVPEVHAIGDALAPRRLIHAVHDGARAGHAV